MDWSINLASGIIESEDERTVDAFLVFQIEETRSEVTEARKELDERKEHREKCLENLKTLENFGNSNIEVTKIWQKLFGEKWIIGIELKNNLNAPAKNIKLILKSKEELPLIYQTKIYTRHHSEIDLLDTICTDPEITKIFKSKVTPNTTSPLNGECVLDTELRKDNFVIISLNIPSFLNGRTATVCGVLTFDQCDKKYQLPFEDQVLQVEEVLSDVKTVNLRRVIGGFEEDFFSLLATNSEEKLIVKMPGRLYRTFEDCLQKDCDFTRASVHTRCNVFVYSGSSDKLNYCALRIRSETAVDAITRDERQFQLLLHHLYSNVPEIAVYNDECVCLEEECPILTRPTQYFQQIENRPPDTDRLKDFISALQKQMKFVETNLLKYAAAQATDGGLENIDLSLTKDEYKIFRNELCRIEKETDHSYLKLFEK